MTPSTLSFGPHRPRTSLALTRHGRSLPSLAALLIVGAPVTAAVPIHTYGALVISPAGDRIASVEGRQSLESADTPHGAIVIRAARDGRILRTIDPCQTWTYSALAWSADGESLAFLASDAKAGTVQVLIDRGGHVEDRRRPQGQKAVRA